jgi:hypothetical protein
MKFEVIHCEILDCVHLGSDIVRHGLRCQVAGPSGYVMSRGRATRDGIWIGDSIHDHLYTQLVTTAYRLLSHAG